MRTPDVTLTSYPGEQATLRGWMRLGGRADGAVIEGLKLDGRSSLPRPSPSIYANEVVLRGNDISNGTGTCVEVNRTPDFPAPSGVVIDDNRIHDCGALPATNRHHGIFLRRSRDAVVRDNWIYDNADRGVQLYPDADGTRVDGNVIDGNGQGIIFGSDTLTSPDQNTVEGNMITNSKIRHNVESHSQGAPYGEGNVVRRHCIDAGARDGGDGGIQSPQRGFTATDYLITDPLYVDRGAKDFNLRPESPCRSLLDDSGGDSEPPPPDDPFDALTLLEEDDASDPDPLGLWGALDAADPLRHEYRTDEAQPYRRLTLLDGDDFFGERVELGELDRDEPTFMRYREGERKVTMLRYRLPSDFPINATGHQAIFQMKRVGGSSVKNPPVLALQASHGKLWLKHNQDRIPTELWSVEPVLGKWFRVAFDITYSQHAGQARIVPWTDLGSGWVQHPAITGYPTLDVEPRSGYRDPQGSSIPNHLRAGIYHAPSIRGTHVDIGSVRVHE